MKKKSFESIISSLEKEGYSSKILEVKMKGPYTSKDSDWNYKDVPHLNIVHESIQGVQPIVANDYVGSINLTKLPIFGIEIPIVVVNYEYSEYNQVYYSSFGPFLIVVNTQSIDIKEGVQVISRFAVLNRPIFNFLVPLIMKIIKKNNDKLMSEDTPMRCRKADLRKINHDFYNPTSTYNFDFTEEIYRANTFIRNGKSNIDININSIIEASDKNIQIGEIDGIMSFFTTKVENRIFLWPTTCPHEGAKLSSNCLVDKRILCPWHHRRISHLAEISMDRKIKIIPSIDYCINIVSESVINISYRNSPEYYNTKPYEIFRAKNLE
ncbi:MAG: hypothetical protein CMF96_06830 [Candidatus Marinimicrobia bacterium]|nr:hypothetical protein [Candidatus Neomarinimicrobiota bacterium]|tara:strand:- start:348 stop:1319 length:972 start_codon:yes stop_codon:yes gene_type:complete